MTPEYHIDTEARRIVTVKPYKRGYFIVRYVDNDYGEIISAARLRREFVKIDPQ